MGVLGSLTLGAGVGWPDGGLQDGGRGSRVWPGLLSAGLAGTSRRTGVVLFHVP